MDWGVALGVIGVLGVAIAPAGIGVPLALADAASPGDFRVARGCFYLSAALFALTTLTTLWFYQEGDTTMRVAVAAVCGALIFEGLTTALDWVRGKQNHSMEKSLSQADGGGKGGDARVVGSGTATGGSGGGGLSGRGGDGGSAEVQGTGRAVGGAGGSAIGSGRKGK
jgi:hypothetical protein